MRRFMEGEDNRKTANVKRWRFWVFGLDGG